MSDDLIDMLVLWWRIERQWTPVQGYPVECPSTVGYRPSRQYDDGNGALDTDWLGREAARVGAVVARIEEPYRSALYAVARNRATGAAVWTSPRLPADRDERAEVVARALELFGQMI